MDIPKKKCIYTVVTAGYDWIFPPIEDQPGWDMLYFTDDPERTSEFWTVLPLPELPELEQVKDDPYRTARLVKILAHRFLQDYDYSVYIDGNRTISGNMDEYIGGHEGDMICLGSSAGDAYAEVDRLLHIQKSTDPLDYAAPLPVPPAERELLLRQTERWKKDGLPEYSGCPKTAIFGRRHNKPLVKKVMESWAKEVLTGSRYDEPAFPYACHLNKAEWTEGLSDIIHSEDLLSPAYVFAPALPHIGIMLGEDPPPKTEYPPNPPPSGGPYGGYPLVLTIGVPVSNQIGTIRRCLEGIKPLLDQLPSELVVVDTGSTDGTLEVCMEYGARVMKFPWINDMSAARNNAIRAARGMFYMSIDDDEYFEDVSEFIEFFSTPSMYEKYDFGFYIQRNYLDEFGKNFTESRAGRVARMTPDLHFEGRIHDALITQNMSDAHYKSEIYYFHTAANHFGFISDNPFVAYRKSQRNVSILKYDMAQFPENLRYVFQMQNEFQFSRRGADVMPPIYWMLSLRRVDKVGLYRTHTLDALAHIPLVFTQYAPRSPQGLDQSLRFVDMDRYHLGDQAFLNNLFALLYMRFGQPHKAHEYMMLRVEQTAELMKLDEQHRNFLTPYFVGNRSTLALVNEDYVLWAEIETDLHKTMPAQQVLLDAPKEMLGARVEYRIKVFKNFLKEHRWSELAALFAHRLKENADEAHNFYPDLDELSKPEHFDGLREALREAKMPPTAWEPILGLRALEPGDANADALAAQALESLPRFGPLPRLYFTMVLICETIRLGADTKPIFAAISIENVDFTTAYLGKKTNERSTAYYGDIFKWQKTDNPSAIPLEHYFRTQCALLVFTKRSNEYLLDGDSYQSHFFKAVEGKWSWLRGLYAEELLADPTKPSPLLPPDVQAISYLHAAVQFYNEDKLKEALECFKDAYGLDKSLRQPITFMKKKMVPMINVELEKSKARENEFSMLLQSIQPKIEQLINAGLYGEARPLVEQLEALIPGSPEIQALRSRLDMTPPS